MKHILLCGGSGSRLWPLSRELMPKQFINLIGRKSLLQLTAEGNREFAKDLIVVCNTDHHFIAQKQLAELHIDPDLFILEPLPKNTTPAICFALLSLDPEEVVLITPADHHINYNEEYAKVIKTSIAYALEERICVFGISPTSPETGYGYIEASGHDVIKFHEKPSLDVAVHYLMQGNFYWNSGMICTKAKVLIKALQKYAPSIFEASKQAYQAAQYADKVCRIPLSEMSKITSESIDYAVLEKAEGLKVVAGNFAWSDLGSFDSLFSHMPKDSHGNAVSTQQDFSTVGSKNNLIIGGNRMISTIDIENLVIVDTEDALLISKLGSTQKVKEIVTRLKEQGRSLHRVPAVEHRPWGNFTVIEAGANYKVKRLVVLPGKRLSLQKHFHRYEHWVVVAGTPIVTIGEERLKLEPNQSVYIPREEIHRIENPGNEDVVIIEVQYGELLSEEDIVRIQDDFARCK